MTAEPAYAEVIEREKEHLQEEMNQRLHMEPPWQLKLTAVLVLWFGINESWDILSGLAEGKLKLNPGCLYTLGAFGLLRRSRRSVLFVKLLMALICISFGVFIGLILWSGFTTGWDPVSLWFDAQHSLPPSGITGKLATLLEVGFFACIAVTLSLRSVRDFLALPPLPQNLPHTRAWMGVMTIILSWMVVEQDWKQKVASYRIQNNFDRDVSIVATDAVTRKRLRDITVKEFQFEGWSWLTVETERESWKAGYSAHGSGEEVFTSVHIECWHRLTPLRLAVSSPGYEQAEITIDKTTPAELLVKLKPVKR